MLSWLGLYFTGSAQIRYQGQVNQQRATASYLHAQLSYSFQKGLRLNITNGSAGLNNQHINAFSDQFDSTLDFISDMWNDLYRATQVIASAFATNNLRVNTACCNVVVAGHARIGEALIMAQV